MEPSSASASASASSPRVYVPISHPDSPVPTYAVLQFVGFSEPSIQNPRFPQALGILQLASSPYAGNRGSGGPCAAGNPNFSSGKPYQQDLCAGHPYTNEICAVNRSPAGSTAAENPNSSAAANRAGEPSFEGLCAAVKSSSQGYCAENHSPEDSYTGNPSPQGSCTSTPNPKTFSAENPSPRSGCADSSSCNSVSKSIDKKFVSIKPSPMKKSGVAGAGAASSGGKKSNKASPVVTAAAISVSHTDRETIVHTHCSNFREVVHQLTGASSEDMDLLPVIVPARLPVNRGSIDGSGNCGDDNGCINNHETVVRSEFAGRVPPRRPITTKLFERRSSKALERLSTGCRDLPPLVPSPVTPLASDFEKICLPLTPTVSPSSMKVMPLQESNAMVLTYPTYNQPAINIYSTMNQPQVSAVQMYLAASLAASHPQGAAVQTSMAMSQHQASAEDLDTAGKGFLLHLQRPRNSEPTLLALFPESPRDQ